VPKLARVESTLSSDNLHYRFQLTTTALKRIRMILYICTIKLTVYLLRRESDVLISLVNIQKLPTLHADPIT